MWSLSKVRRSGLAVALAMVAGLAVPGTPTAEADRTEAIAAPWQQAISSQIEAFRQHDANAAFDYAGFGFRIAFPDAEQFFEAVIRSGFAPIAQSHAHSFGQFRAVGATTVIQQVRFVGRDQTLYGALYQVREEKEGWRVQAVQLVAERGMVL